MESRSLHQSISRWGHHHSSGICPVEYHDQGLWEMYFSVSGITVFGSLALHNQKSCKCFVPTKSGCFIYTFAFFSYHQCLPESRYADEWPGCTWEKMFNFGSKDQPVWGARPSILCWCWCLSYRSLRSKAGMAGSGGLALNRGLWIYKTTGKFGWGRGAQNVKALVLGDGLNTDLPVNQKLCPKSQLTIFCDRLTQYPS